MGFEFSSGAGVLDGSGEISGFIPIITGVVGVGEAALGLAVGLGVAVTWGGSAAFMVILPGKVDEQLRILLPSESRTVVSELGPVQIYAISTLPSLIASKERVATLAAPFLVSPRVEVYPVNLIRPVFSS